MLIIDRRKFLCLYGKAAGCIALSPLLFRSTGNCASSRPNIVFFLIDDLGWRDLACFGSDFYETPEIDQLAAEGVRFNQAYSAFPLCTPSRLAIMSGKYPTRMGMPGRLKGLPESETTFAEIFRQNGYKTFFTGKWHLGKKGNPEYPTPEKQGFDINIGGHWAGQPGSYFYPYKGRGKVKKPNGEILDFQVPHLENGDEGEYLTDRLTDEAVKFIRNNKKNPFLVFLSHYAVHTPIEGKPALDRKYNEKLMSMDLPKPMTYEKEGTGVGSMNQNHTTYAAMVESVDESVGKIMKLLKELSLDENTIIIFTSDNGGLSNTGYAQRELATSNYPLRAGKGWCYEGGIRVPMIVKWPNVASPGTESESIVIGMDYYPSMLEMAGLPLIPEQHKDGVSFVDVLKGRKKHVRTKAFWHSPFGNLWYVGDSACSVIRDGDYKLIDWYENGIVELFNLKSDLSEKNDLSKEMPDKAKEMLGKLNAWRKDMNAFIKEN
jgi:arylsulfatase A-like enzyme